MSQSGVRHRGCHPLLARFRAGLMLPTLLLGCSSSHATVEPPASSPAAAADAGATVESEPLGEDAASADTGSADATGPVAVSDLPFVDENHHIVRSGCDAQPFAPDSKIGEGAACLPGMPNCGPRIACVGPWNCTKTPFGRCVGSAFFACEYSGVRTAESCTEDADCATGAEGRCRTFIPFTSCQYSNHPICEQTSDCAGGERCACTGQWMTCAEAACLDDADCGADRRCRRGYDDCGFPTGGFHCTTDRDGCAGDEDCDVGRCDFDRGAGHWACDPSPACSVP